MKKVLFFDIDGTLMNTAGIVPDSAKKALEQARLAGCQTVICSGRSGHQMQKWMYDDFDGVINCTGARVIFNGETIYEHFVPTEDVKRAREVLSAAGGVLVGQTERCAILSKESYEYMYDFLRSNGRSEERIQNMLGKAILTDRMEECGEIKKFFYHRSSKSVEELAKELGDIFTIEGSSFLKNANDCGEITSIGINKSFGMKKYLEYQGLDRECAIAFGDGPNDVDMLEYAKIGVAMGNGRDEIKRISDFITKDIDDDGIAYAMVKLGLINVY